MSSLELRGEGVGVNCQATPISATLDDTRIKFVTEDQKFQNYKLKKTCILKNVEKPCQKVTRIH